MKELNVFRVQPESFQRWKAFLAKVSPQTEERGREAKLLREQLKLACESPPEAFAARAIKADLQAFSVYLEPDEHKKMKDLVQSKGISKNIFIETVFNNLPLPA